MRARALFIGVFSALLFAGATVVAQVDIREEPIHFKKGETGATVKGSIKGSQSVDYRLRAQKGQPMVVNFKSSNSSAYFNVIAPGADSAMFVGSSSGSHFEGELPADGEYTIRVYLMRNAGRRNETAHYTLEVGIGGGLKASAASPATATWPARYDASGSVKCSEDQPGLDRTCGFRVLRDQDGKTAEIWIARIAHKDEVRFRVLYFVDGKFTTNDKAELSWKRESDNWRVSVDGKEFYLIPDALIYGG
jgi:hypothetical protein